MLLTGFVAFSNHANAIPATGGNGRMGTAINWVEWGAEHDVISGSKMTWTKPVEAGPSKWMSTRCSLEPTAGASDALSSSKSVTVYRPGNYGVDGLGQMYFDKAPGYGNKMKIGLATTSDGEKVTFDFSCSAYLINSGSDSSGNLNDSTNTSGSNFFNIPLQGLVFADAESNNWTYYQSEYIKATPKKVPTRLGGSSIATAPPAAPLTPWLNSRASRCASVPTVASAPTPAAPAHPHRCSCKVPPAPR